MTDKKQSLAEFSRDKDTIAAGLSAGAHKLTKMGNKQLLLLEYENPQERPVMLVIDDEQGSLDDANYLKQLRECADDEYKKSLVLHTFNPYNDPHQDIQQLIKHHQADRLDVVVLDMHMPGKDGLELLTIIRADPLTRYLPVIIVTQSKQDSKKQGVKASQQGAQRTIFAKSAEPRLLYDIIMSLESARDQLMDQRWMDLLKAFSLLTIQNSETANTVQTLLQQTGQLVEKTMDVSCLIRLKRAKEDSFVLEYHNDPVYPVDLKIVASKIPAMKKLMHGPEQVLIFDQFTEDELGNSEQMQNDIDKYLGRPVMLCRLDYKNKTLGMISLYKNKGAEGFREKDKVYVQNLVFQLASYIAEIGDAEELRDNQLSIADFAKKMSEKNNDKTIINFLGERLHQIINTEDKIETKTTIRLLKVASASLHQVFTTGIAESVNEPINISRYQASCHARSAITGESVLYRDV